MEFREANLADIPQLSHIRLSVRENSLSDPTLVTNADYENFLTVRGKGWLCETDNKVVGFAIADLLDHNVWALFILPDYEGKGIGKKLHQIMLNWYFSQTDKSIWLSTGYNTRAEKFYTLNGWQPAGPYGKMEVKFTMAKKNWLEQLNG